MSETHISYEVSKRLKEFLGESAPEPIGEEWYFYLGCAVESPRIIPNKNAGKVGYPPAYQLHDLLSKPFCEAMLKEGIRTQHISQTEYEEIKEDWAGTLADVYFNGGLPAVEKALMEMMEGK